jgi:hypothetical protein
MSLPVLECTAVGDEIQDFTSLADNTILSSAGDARADDLNDIAADEDVSEKESKIIFTLKKRGIKLDHR